MESINVVNKVRGGESLELVFNINNPFDVIGTVLGEDSPPRIYDDRKCRLVRTLVRAIVYINDMGGYTSTSIRKLVNDFIGDVFGETWTAEDREAGKMPDLALLQDPAVVKNIESVSTRVTRITVNRKILTEFEAIEAERQSAVIAGQTPRAVEDIIFRGLVGMYYLPRAKVDRPTKSTAQQFVQMGKFISHELVAMLDSMLKDPTTTVVEEEMPAPVKPAAAETTTGETVADKTAVSPAKQAQKKTRAADASVSYRTADELFAQLKRGQGSPLERAIFAMGQRFALEQMQQNLITAAVSAATESERHYSAFARQSNKN